MKTEGKLTKQTNIREFGGKIKSTAGSTIRSIETNDTQQMLLVFFIFDQNENAEDL